MTQRQLLSLPADQEEAARGATAASLREWAQEQFETLDAEWVAVCFLPDGTGMARPQVVDRGPLEDWPSEERQDELSEEHGGAAVFMLYALPMPALAGPAPGPGCIWGWQSWRPRFEPWVAAPTCEDELVPEQGHALTGFMDTGSPMTFIDADSVGALGIGKDAKSTWEPFLLLNSNLLIAPSRMKVAFRDQRGVSRTKLIAPMLCRGLTRLLQEASRGRPFNALWGLNVLVRGQTSGSYAMTIAINGEDLTTAVTELHMGVPAE